MRQIKTINKNNKNEFNNQILVESMYKLRGEVFKDRLGWEVELKDGLEIDDFDGQNPSYVTLLNDQQNIIGCWRALPTTERYMLKDIFPQLLRGEEAPQERNVYEISRFAISKNREGKEKRVASHDTAELVRSFFSFAQENGITDYVLVTTVACERILKYLGVNMRRMGDGKSMKVGIERSVALWIKVDENLNIAAFH